MHDDEYIQKLLDQICSQTGTSARLERSRALTKLLIYVQRSPKLWRSSHQDYSSALNLTLEWFSKNVSSFIPRSSVAEDLMRFVNGYLRWRIRDLYISDANYQEASLDDFTYEGENRHETIAGSSPEPLTVAQEHETESIAQAIWEALQQDDQDFLRECRPHQGTGCDCRGLVYRHLMQEPPETIRAIASQSGIKEQTLYSHWRSKCLPRVRIVALRVDTPLKQTMMDENTQRQLEDCYVQEHPRCNCRELVNRLVLADSIEQTKAIARELGIKESELWQHWEEQCLPLLRTIRHYLQTQDL